MIGLGCVPVLHSSVIDLLNLGVGIRRSYRMGSDNSLFKDLDAWLVIQISRDPVKNSRHFQLVLLFTQHGLLLLLDRSWQKEGNSDVCEAVERSARAFSQQELEFFFKGCLILLANG
jgi:hypothetical protein